MRVCFISQFWKRWEHLSLWMLTKKKTREKTRKPTKTKLFWCVGTLYDHFMTKQKVYQPCVSHLTALIGQIWCFTTNIGT